MSTREPEGKATILIVEDNSTMAQMMSVLLEREGHSAVVAENGEEALQMLGLGEPTAPEPSISPDLILLDILLPGLDGFEVCARIREDERLNHVPVIMVTALGSLMDTVKGLQCGADDYIAKPFKTPELLARVRAMLRLKRLHDERKRTEEALRESGERFRVALAHSPIVVFNQDRELRYTWVYNPDPRISTEAILGKTEAELFPPEEASRLTEIKRQALETGVGVREEASTTINGVTYSFDFTVEPLRDPAGTIVGITCAAMDITKRKRAEDELRRTRDYLDSLIHYTSAPTIVWNQERRITLFNRAFEHLAGYTADQVIGQELDTLFPEASRDESLRRIKRALGGEYWESVEIPILCKDGETRLVLWNSANIYAQDNTTLLATIAQGQDITQRKRAEEALRRSMEETVRGQRLLLALSQAAQAVQRAYMPEEVYRTVGDEITGLSYHAIVFRLTDDRAHLTLSYVSFEPASLRAVEKLAGISMRGLRFEVVPGGIFDQIIAEERAIFFERIVEPMVETLPMLTRPLIERIVATLGIEQAIYAPMRIGDETHGLLVVTGVGLTEVDVPAVTAFAGQAAIALDNARLYEAERTARERLRDLAGYLQTAREEERTRIAREIHDELGQALTALKMDLSWLAKRLPADQPRLLKKAGDMSRLVDETIQAVRSITTELRPGLLDDLGLAAAVEWQAQEFAERTGIDCELRISDEEMPPDRDLATAIFRIFQETLTNVARHAEATKVLIDLEQRSDELVLVVRDNGKGITRKQLSSSKSLGLIGMQERARTWGGDVTFKSTRGQGTTVSVQIPLPSGEGVRNDQGSGSR